ncbi:MAG: hypothetical protein Q8N34_03245 [Gammaproteobacteria bacterium]|nr:hypothetical protein [Gammaproteobacteria bacterium]
MRNENTLRTDNIENFLKSAEIEIVTRSQADKPEALILASQVQDWYLQEKTIQAENRIEMATDAAFYDGDQWTDDEKAELEERNQYPSVINLIKPTIDWLTGTEKRVRTDWKVLPTTKDGGEDAKIKTHVLKYIAEVNHAAHKKSAAFAHAVKVGLGWRELGVRGDLTDEPIFIGHVNWRDMTYDSQASDPMFIEDGRYMFRDKVVDLDVALAMFPDRAEELKLAALSTYDKHWDYANSEVQLYFRPTQISSGIQDALTTFHNRRLIVRLVEGWYRKPVKVKKIKLSDKFPWGADFDPENAEMVADVEDAQTRATLYDKVEMRMFVCVFIHPGFETNRSGGRLLLNCRSPYKHGRFPFVPIWAFRKDSDNTPYGVIRNQRDPQKDFNKRHSKAQHILSTKGVSYEEGAIDDEDKLAEELARPDFIIRFNKGKEFNIHESRELAAEHVQIATLDEQYIRQSSGVTGENMGLQTNATSGIAIQRRQNEGGVITQDLFDNSILHDQVCGEILLSLVEQFMDLPKQIAIAGDHGQEFIDINMPDETGENLLNDITARKAKFKVSEQDYNASVRQAMFEELMKLVTSLPGEIAMQLLDAVIDLSDIPERKELVRRIRQINGHSDPDDISEEEMASAEAAKKEAQAELARLQKAEQEAKIRKDNADANLKEVNASRINVQALLDAFEAAGIALVVSPQQTQMADSMVQEGKAPTGQPPAPQPQLNPQPM